MTVGICDWEGRVSCVKTRYSLPKRKVVEALRERIVGQNREAARHALLHRRLQRVIDRINICDICLDGRKRVGGELSAAGGSYQRIRHPHTRLARRITAGC